MSPGNWKYKHNMYIQCSIIKPKSKILLHATILINFENILKCFHEKSEAKEHMWDSTLENIQNGEISKTEYRQLGQVRTQRSHHGVILKINEKKVLKLNFEIGHRLLIATKNYHIFASTPTISCKFILREAKWFL